MTIEIDSAMGTAKEALGTAKHAAEGAADAVKYTAGDAAKNIRKAVTFLRDIGVDDLLSVVGLRRKTSPFASIAMVGGGVVIGAGLALLLAPATGAQARMAIARFFTNAGGRAADEVKEKAGEVAGEVKERVGEVKERAGEVAGEVKSRVGEKVGQVQEKVGEVLGKDNEGESAQGGEEGGDEKKGRRRHNTNASVS